MKVDIFIRTYSADVELLGYCLRSIEKHCQGFRNVIITVPARDRHLLGYDPRYQVHTVPHFQDDYLGQQSSKLHAHHFSDADLILYVDSDCIFTEPVTPKSFMVENKPLILKTRYDKMSGDVLNWKPITEKALGFKVEYEYMRRLPLMYWREDLSQLQNALQIRHAQKLETYIVSQPLRAFTEFNVFGAFCEHYYGNKYTFQDTELGVPKAVAIQFWSHDFRNENRNKIIEKIEGILK
jgi:hypothetical protein